MEPHEPADASLKEAPASGSTSSSRRRGFGCLRLLLVALGLLALAVGMVLWNPIRTLASLERLDDHPLLVMTWRGGYDYLPTDLEDMMSLARRFLPEGPDPGCTLFAALGGEGGGVVGRNFDWPDCPILVLRTDPPEGYASISLVDISYLGFDAASFDDLPGWGLRARLLLTPLMPFDGMNEEGLAISMAAVPRSRPPFDPELPTVHQLVAMRLILDRCRTVPEALELMRGRNVVTQPGPHVHFLLADARGGSAVVELLEGRLEVIEGPQPWLAATNFHLRHDDEAEVGRERFDRAMATLEAARGRLDVPEAMALLQQCRLEGGVSTQWSAVYELGPRQLHLATGGRYDRIHHLTLRGR